MWAKRSNFEQAVLDRAPDAHGETINIDWDLRDEQYACSFVYFGDLTYAAHHLTPMSNDEYVEFLDAQLAARAERNVPFACPDLDQEYGTLVWENEGC